MKILLAIPTYNEFGNIDALLQSILKETKNIDILLVDDNSTDGTIDVINKYKNNFKFINLIINKFKSGVGSAHLDAINYAYKNDYKFLITMDADFTHHPKYINRMIMELGDNDIIIASRHENLDSLKTWPFFRKLLTRMAYFYSKFLLGIHFDSTSGFRLYNLKKIKEEIFHNIKSKSYSFFIETSFLINKTLKVKSLSIDMPIRFAEKSKMKFIDMLNTIIIMIILLIKKIFRF